MFKHLFLGRATHWQNAKFDRLGTGGYLPILPLHHTHTANSGHNSGSCHISHNHTGFDHNVKPDYVSYDNSINVGIDNTRDNPCRDNTSSDSNIRVDNTSDDNSVGNNIFMTNNTNASNSGENCSNNILSKNIHIETSERTTTSLTC